MALRGWLSERGNGSTVKARVLLILLAFLPMLPARAEPPAPAFDPAPKAEEWTTTPAPAPPSLPTTVKTQPQATATNVSLTGDANRTSVRIDLSRGVTAEIFTLSDPYRVIVDLPDLTFKLPETAGQQSQGLIKTFRFGLFAEKKARLVFDATGPVGIEKAAMANTPNGTVVFTFDLVRVSEESFGQGTGIEHHAKEAAAPPVKGEPAKPAKKSRPVVVIDAGHGGIDGGAQGAMALEKTIVLSVAKQLEAALKRTNRYDVYMTRTKDVFISLDQRLGISEKLGADLFISLHADSLAEQEAAQAVRGATVYTLSEKASDEQARRMAEKENASDLLAGLAPRETEGADQVKSILFDLMKRETSNFSADFSRVLVQNLRRKTALSKDPMRHAAFKVLKQTHAPSVLVELGYLSNAEDERLLASPEWQGQVAAAIAASVDSFFAKRAP